MTAETLKTTTPLQILQRRWWLVALLLVLGAGLAYGLLRAAGLAAPAWRWVALVATVLAYELWLLRRHLPDNHRHNETMLFPGIGAANGLTLVRGLILALLAGFLFVPWPPGRQAWIPALLYLSAALADIFDGILARRTNQTTVLGEILDIEFDSLGLLIVSALAVWYGQLPAWYLVLGLSRYLFLGGMAWRRRRGLTVHPLPASMHRRIVAALQMGFMTVILWPIIDPTGSRFAAIWFGLALALSFGRDWLIVSGRLDAESPAYRRAQGRLYDWVRYRLAPLTRLVAVILATSILAPAVGDPSTRVALLAWPGLPGPQVTATAALALGLMGIPLLALGVVGRLAALALTVPTATYIFDVGLTWQAGVLLAGLVFLMHVGSGALSLWPLDDRIWMRRARRGEKS